MIIEKKHLVDILIYDVAGSSEIACRIRCLALDAFLFPLPLCCLTRSLPSSFFRLLPGVTQVVTEKIFQVERKLKGRRCCFCALECAAVVPRRALNDPSSL